MPAPVPSVPNSAMKPEVHGHCHEVQNTEVIYSTLNYIVPVPKHLCLLKK